MAVQPVYGPDYSQMLLQGINTYRGIQDIQRGSRRADEDAEVKALVADPEVGRDPTKLRRLMALNPNAAALIQKDMEASALQTRTGEIKDLSLQARTDPEALTNLMMLDPQRGEALSQQLARKQSQAQASQERFEQERPLVSASLKDRSPEEQKQILMRRVVDLEAQGRDPSNSLRMLDMLTSEDPAIVQQANMFIANDVMRGEHQGILTRATAPTVPEKQKLFQFAFDPANATDPAAQALQATLVDTPNPPEKAQLYNMAYGRGSDRDPAMMALRRNLEAQITDPAAPKTPLMRNAEAAGHKEGTLKYQNFIQEQLAKPAAKGAPLTAMMKNVMAMTQSQPGEPKFQKEFAKQMEKQGAGTTVVIGGASEQKELGKLRVQNYAGLQARALTAQNQLASLDILDSIDVRTGKLEPLKQSMAAWGESFGMNTKRLANVSAGEAYTAESGKMVLNVMASQKGPQTKDDMIQIRTTISGLGNTEEANQFINSSARAISLRTLEERDFKQEWLQEKDTLDGADKAWNDRKRGTPMIAKNLKTPEGLPMFYFQFKQYLIEKNPDMTEDRVRQLWNNHDKKP